MAIETVCRCNKCNKVIEDEQGFVVSGNIHINDSKEDDHIGGGLVGNNFDTNRTDRCVINHSYYCKRCLGIILGLIEDSAIRTSNIPSFPNSILRQEGSL